MADGLNGTTAIKAMLLGGLVAGIVDIGAASLINWINPTRILLVIASGVLGKPAFQGGSDTALLGLALQCAMSLIIAAIYVLAALRLPILRLRWISGGLLYGVAIFFVMNFVVVPLSAVGHVFRFTPLSFTEHMLAMLLFGLIVTAALRWVTAPKAM